jgi:hypothetical protein
MGGRLWRGARCENLCPRTYVYVLTIVLALSVTTVTVTEQPATLCGLSDVGEKVCDQKFLRDFTASCRKMSPLVEFTTRAQVYLLLIGGTLRTYRTAKQTMNATVTPTLYSTPHVTASPRAFHNWREADELLEIPIPTLATSRTAKTSSAMPVTTTINLSRVPQVRAVLWR